MDDFFHSHIYRLLVMWFLILGYVGFGLVCIIHSTAQSWLEAKQKTKARH